MHIRAKGVVEGVWYGLAYLITEDDLIRIIAKWPPTWLEPGASFLKTPTKPRTATQPEKLIEKPIEKEATPTTPDETIDLEKDTEPEKNDIAPI